MEFKEDLFVKWSSECKYRVRSEYKVYPEQVVAPGIISKAYMESYVVWHCYAFQKEVIGYSHPKAVLEEGNEEVK